MAEVRFPAVAHADRHAVRGAVRPCRTLGDEQGPEVKVVPFCNITLTKPNDWPRPIDDRMPVVLSMDVDFWLDGCASYAVALADVLKPYPADRMDAYEMSSLANL